MLVAKTIDLFPHRFRNGFFGYPVEQQFENPLLLFIDDAVLQRHLLEQLQFRFVERPVVGKRNKIGIGRESACGG